MKSVYSFIVEPIGERYKNTSKVGDVELVMNTEMFNHQHVNREAKILSVPQIGVPLNPRVGDIVTLHHNVFRRWHDVKGKERNRRSFLKEGEYIVALDQIFLYKRDKDWICPKGYCFVQPIKDNSQLSAETERPHIGIVKYSDGTVDINELVGFKPSSEFEFVIDGQRMYRVLSNFITIKYEYQGDEEEYNPSWAQGS